MPRDAKIMSEALHRFQADKERRNARLERRTEEIYRRVPAVERIDRELRGTAARIVAAAFSEGGDPEKALEQLAAGNLALQRERAELLVGGGYAYDCIDDAPVCRLCQDSGYLRDGTACRCLMSYYAREQNRRLSRLLDLAGRASIPSPLTGTTGRFGPSSGPVP